MRGCKKYPLVKVGTHGEEGEGGSGTYLGCTRSCCSDERKGIEDELCASGESKENNVKIANEYEE
jgi:hypothetical protein